MLQPTGTDAGQTTRTRCAASERPNLVPKPSKLLSLSLLLFFSAGSALALDPSRLISQYGHAQVADWLGRWLSVPGARFSGNWS
jgi:hypothetical protein